MKKILCAVLAVSMLFLASCSSKLSYGTYYSDSDNPNECKLVYRSESSFSIIYNNKYERGTCVKEEGKITVDINDSDCVYVFDISEDKLVYNADKSVPSEEFVSSGLVSDGEAFFLAFEAKGK